MFLRFLFIFLFSLSLAACSDAISSTQAPDFSGQSLNGDTVNSETLQGKVTLVKFWATDCTTRVAQMPDI